MNSSKLRKIILEEYKKLMMEGDVIQFPKYKLKPSLRFQDYEDNVVGIEKGRNLFPQLKQFVVMAAKSTKEKNIFRDRDYEYNLKKISEHIFSNLPEERQVQIAKDVYSYFKKNSSPEQAMQAKEEMNRLYSLFSRESNIQSDKGYDIADKGLKVDRLFHRIILDTVQFSKAYDKARETSA